MIRYVVFAEFVAYGIFMMFTSCIIDPSGTIKKPIPTATATVSPTPKPRLTDIPPYPTATPEPTVRPYILQAPELVEQCKTFKVSIQGPHEKDDIVIWAERTYHIGRMFYDAAKDEKYLTVKLSSSGERQLDFKMNGSWQISHKILVEPRPENCSSFL